MQAREDRRYWYLLADDANGKRKKQWTRAMEVGAKWYKGGYMVRAVYQSSQASWCDCYTFPYDSLTYVGAWQVRDCGTQATQEEVLALFPIMQKVEAR